MLDTLSNVTTTYTYDLNGNMLTMDDGSGTVKKFTVNEINQLTQYNDGKGTNVCYAYNASGLRSQKSQADITGSYINYYYSPNGSLLNEEDNTNVMSSYLIAGSRTSRTVGGTTQWYISNGKDMVATVSPNSDGTLTSSNVYNYDAYGKESDLSTPSSNSQTPTANSFNITDNPFKYSSYYLDAESGLYYLQARYYSPELMKFISMDTYDLANKYAYGNGDPIANTDPQGHSAERIVAGVVFGLMASALSFGSSYFLRHHKTKAGIGFAVAAVVMGVISAGCFGDEMNERTRRRWADASAAEEREAKEIPGLTIIKPDDLAAKKAFEAEAVAKVTTEPKKFDWKVFEGKTEVEIDTMNDEWLAEQKAKQEAKRKLALSKKINDYEAAEAKKREYVEWSRNEIKSFHLGLEQAQANWRSEDRFILQPAEQARQQAEDNLVRLTREQGLKKIFGGAAQVSNE